MLAEKVETYEDFRDACDDGFTLFQGYFFCRPEIVATKDIATSKASLAALIGRSGINRTWTFRSLKR